MTEQELALENLRLDLESRKHDDDIALRRRELDLQEKREGRAAWRSPMFLAIGAGVIGILGNAVVAIINGSAGRDLERQKAEAALVLQSLGTGDPDTAAANLRMLVDTGLVTEAEIGIREYLAQRISGEGAALPSPTVNTRPKESPFKMIHIQKLLYPSFYNWLRMGFPKVREKQRIWNAFVKYSGLSETLADELFSGAIRLLVDVREFDRYTYSIFDSDSQNRVSFNRYVVNKFEASEKNAAARAFLEAKLLRAMVHWGQFRVGLEPNGFEAGDQFEKEAYGRILGEFWSE